jgi:hypothetical protein
MADVALGSRHLEYKTWYDFKMTLESKLGYGLPVSLWLRMKPQKPLPWVDADFQATLSAILRMPGSASGKPKHPRAGRVL